MSSQSSDLAFGVRVIVTQKLVRKEKTVPGQHCWTKKWERISFMKPQTGILIGFRTLANGIMRPCGEDGMLFTPQEYINVALVVLNERMNPIYVSMEDIKNARS